MIDTIKLVVAIIIITFICMIFGLLIDDLFVAWMINCALGVIAVGHFKPELLRRDK